MPRRSRWCTLVARLRLGGFALLDTQFLTDHLKTFGATEVPQERYGHGSQARCGEEADISVFERDLSGADAVRLATAA